MKTILNRILFLCFVYFGVLSSVCAKDIPDYYEEAGFSASRDSLNQTDFEYIDPFSGILNLHHTDLVIPGEGGMDLKIQRSYSNIHETSQLPPRTPTGLGWTLHFGRVLKSDLYFCSQNPTTVLDNPVLELPDGSRQILADADIMGKSYLYITQNRWKAVCKNYSNGSGNVSGLEVWSPDGTKYDMGWLSPENRLYPTKITDRNGNYFNIYYENVTNSTLITSVTTSDYRTVSFGYSGSNSDKRLTAISANGQVWNYSYSAVSGTSGNYYYLDRVTRPGDNLYWDYTYKTSSGAGKYSINKVIHPHGGSINYTYDHEIFLVSNPKLTTTVKSKSSSDGGNWTFNYLQYSSYDKTTVNTPNGTITYKHFGATAATYGTLWKIGLLLEKTIGGSQTETYSWNKQKISDENYARLGVMGTAIDNEYYAPILTQKTVRRDGTNYTTTYSNHDEFGSPRIINQSGNETLNKTVTYEQNESKWILNFLKNETVSGGDDISRTFDSRGNLLNETRYGVPKNYTYTTRGDILSYTDPGGKKTTYSNYYRGIARQENQPESITIKREVNNTGTVKSVTNGENRKTSYLYNRLNQLTNIDLPENTDVSISHSKSNRRTTRGGYTNTIEYDSFGRIESVKNSGGGDSVITKYDYNALGQKTFESYPSSSSGVNYNYDELGRLEGAVYSGGGTENYYFYSGNRVKFTGQKNHSTTYTYRSYGDPDDRVLKKIESPLSITTTIGRDKQGQITSIQQGTKTRTYKYNSRNYIYEVSNPETGTTYYGRDNAGNMKSKRVGSSPTTYYIYDDQHRLKTINYPSGTADVTFTYDDNHNLKTVSNGVGNRSYNYDQNDNLELESLAIGGETFTIQYGIDNLDHIDDITYPSNRVVDYSPNDLGRPTEASPYISSVNYHPNGVPSSIFYANGISTNITLTSRKMVDKISTSTSDPLGLDYGYDNNGNISSIKDDYEFGFNLSLTYDSVNRLDTASGTWGNGNIDYDTNGNIKKFSLGGTNTSYSYKTSGLLDRTTGRDVRTYSYDKYGNATSNGNNDFDYDDASNLTDITGSVIVSYGYDGNKMKVSQTKEGITTYLLYAKNGDLMGEYSTDGTFIRENIYLNQKLVAAVENVPSAPLSLSNPTHDTNGSYDVSWTAASGGAVTSYQLFEATQADFGDEVLISEEVTLNASVTGRAVGVYHYRVRSCASDMCSDFTEGTNSTFVGFIPGKPGALTIPNASESGSYGVNWGGSSGNITHYELYEASSFDFQNEQQVYSGLGMAALSGQHSGTYYYRVKACYQTICSEYSIGSNSVAVDRTPGTPSSISLPETESDGSYTVTWGTANGYGKPVSYEVFEATNNAFLEESVVYSGSSLTVALAGRMAGQSYYYRVRSCTNTKCSIYITGATAVAVDGAVPGLPANITVPLSNNTGEFAVSWLIGSGDVTHYELFQADNVSFTGEVLSASVVSTEKVFSNLPSGKYYYRVRACNLNGCGALVTATNAIDVLQPPPTPTNITVPADDIDGVYSVSWGGSGGNLAYYELVETTASGSTILYTGLNETFFVTYRESGVYTYSVRACSQDACSQPVTGQVVVSLYDYNGQIRFFNYPEFDDTGSYTTMWLGYLITTQYFILEESTDSGFSVITKTFNIPYQQDASFRNSQLIDQDKNGYHYYRVRACFADGRCTRFFEAYRYTGQHGVYEAGKVVLPVADASKSYVVSWATADSAGDGSLFNYALYQATNSSFSDEVLVYSGPNLSATISPPDDGYYYYRVKPTLSNSNNTYNTRVADHPVHEIGYKIFPAVMVSINSLLLN